ncbi:pilus assembly protein [Noviherbaspirillum cavernae]|uniref:Pilus assembly protein n=1 Tax=Noviherbaspirillum cavernae TaxID=2320862 RepID=A0A418WYZ5_9BURK|nr:TadE family protein [Noviherbaspirillum cavernae]RJG05323.1 pilus assembly protein [Noviherbaspirillum cavernae]
MMNRRIRSRHTRQRGQALAEYIYVFPILALLILGAIQFGFIYQTKSTLNYATFAATRQGALNNGSMSAIAEGLVSGMMPLFTHSSSTGGARNMDLLKNAWQLADEQVRNPKITSIRIVNPTPTTLNSYQGQSEKGDEIPNDNLMYRSTNIPGGSMNIQDANLLKVRVTYCYRMAVPILNKLIFHLVVDPPGTPSVGTTAADMIASEGGGATSKPCTGIDDEYRIPVTSEAVVRMQSPFRDPGKWIGP